MSATEQGGVPFAREDRYIVIKLSDLGKVPLNFRSSLLPPLNQLQTHLPRRDYLVIESDWPEYQKAWEMIEARMTGKQPVSDEPFPNCDYCGFVPDYHPWHGSGDLNGKPNPHIHACESCRHLLPHSPNVAGLVEALEGVVKRCSRASGGSGYVGVDGQYLKVIDAALTAYRAQQGQ